MLNSTADVICGTDDKFFLLLSIGYLLAYQYDTK